MNGRPQTGVPASRSQSLRRPWRPSGPPKRRSKPEQHVLFLPACGLKLTRPLFFLLFRDGSIDIGLVVVTPCQAFRAAQEIAYQGKKTANLLGVNQTVIGP